MNIKIALAGNPNSGKTTLFNALTGNNQYVGNWPGVTVEKKEGKLKTDKNIMVTDLPGIYSLSPYTLEEAIARDYLLQEKPDVIINILDGTNLERNLYLTTQLLELPIPVVVAINMMDVVNKNNDLIKIEKLAKELGCNVVEISAMKGKGIEKAIELAISVAKEKKEKKPLYIYGEAVEHALAAIEKSIVGIFSQKERRFFAIKIFEHDSKVIKQLEKQQVLLDKVEPYIEKVKKEMNDDEESIITNERYLYIEKVIKECYRKNQENTFTISDKIDRIITNRWLGLPIFAVVMFLVYYISVTWIGALVTEFTNDTLFGEWISPTVSNVLESMHAASWLKGLLVDGIVGGVGAVLGFVPQIFVLFILLAILEECGYMSRIAFVLDRIFRKFGLSGKSFIPMLIGTGCSIPGIMASRTIENERDRRMTIMTTSFMPCGAKLPIIALIAGALFGGAGWVAPSAYFAGIAAIVISGLILKKTKPFAGDPAPFVMELPSYHIPTISGVLRSMWERGWSFIKKAGTIILVSAIFIWFTSSYSWSLKSVSDYDGSILESIGSVFAWAFKPLGFGNGKAAVASIFGLVAKENVVGTFGILYNFAGEVSEDGNEIWAMLQADYSPLQGFSFLLFNLLCAPCFAAIGAIKREMNSRKWTWFAIGYQCIFAYAVSLCVYQIGMLFTGNGNILGTIAALFLIVFTIYMLVRPYQDSTKIK